MNAPAKFKKGDRVVLVRDDKFALSPDAWCYELLFKTFTISSITSSIISVRENGYGYKEDWLILESLYYSPLNQALR